MLVKRLRSAVRLADLQRNRGNAILTRKVEAAVHQRVGDSSAPLPLFYGNLIDVHLVEEPHGEDVTDDFAVATSDEVQSRFAAQFALEKLSPPRRGKRARLQPMNVIDVFPRGRSDFEVGHVRRSLTSASAKRT